MDTSVFIARIFGAVYLVIAIGMLLNGKFYQKVMEDFPKNTALVLFSGMFALIIGIVIVTVHNIWAANWTVIITIIGWMGVLKGSWFIIFPETLSKFMQIYKKNPDSLKLHSITALVLGAFLTFAGYLAG